MWCVPKEERVKTKTTDVPFEDGHLIIIILHTLTYFNLKNTYI